MKRMILFLAFLGLLAHPAAAQTSEVKFIADTLVVQAEGTFDSGATVRKIYFPKCAILNRQTGLPVLAS